MPDAVGYPEAGTTEATDRAAGAPEALVEMPTRDPARRRRLSVTFAVCGAALLGALSWLAPFFVRFAGVPHREWAWRDDAVITLSEARNAALYGTVGLSPGTGRVEAYSTPLQFVLAAGAFLIHPMSYEAFLDGYVAVSIGATGILLTLVVYRVVRGLTACGTARSVAVAVGLSTVAAVITVSQYTPAAWLVSGMENPLYLALALWLVSCCVDGTRTRARAIEASIALSLLGIVRVETFTLLLPALAATVAVLCVGLPRRPAVTNAAILVVVPLAFWGAINLGRYVYFGHLFPTSALAEGKSGGPRQVLAIALVSLSFWSFLAYAVIPRLHVARERRYRAVALGLGAASATALAVLVLLGQTDGLFSQLFGTPHWYPPYFSPGSGVVWLLVAVAVLLALDRRANGTTWTPHFVFASLAILPMTQFVVFGPARLDAHRVSSLAIPVLAAWLVVLLVRVGVAAGRMAHLPAARVARPLATFGLVAGLVVVGGTVQAAAADPPHGLCCDFRGSGTPHLLTLAAGFQHRVLSSGVLPILANPDLGVMSFPKSVVIDDLGELGDPVLTHLVTDEPALVATYLNQVATPDVVEVHAFWSCLYRDWINSPYFQSHYRVLYRGPATGSRSYCPYLGDYVVWQRTNSATEYDLTLQLHSSPDPVQLVQLELSRCSNWSGDAFRCEFVRRAVLRNYHTLVDEGAYGAVVSAFDRSPAKALDLALLTGGSGWDDAAYRAFLALAPRTRAS